MGCGETSHGDADIAAYRCGACSADLKYVPLATGVDPDVEVGGVWRYAALLPVSATGRAAECAAPLRVVSASLLGERLGISDLWVVDCTNQRTGTFKDLEADVVLAMVHCLGSTPISVHSTGNTALAYRQAAIEFGVDCASYIPLANLNKMRGATPSSKHPIVAVDAPYTAVSVAAKRHAADHNYLHMAPMPWKLEGKAAVAWTIADALPDAQCIVQTVAGGYGPLGYELGFRRARSAGWFNAAPVLRRRSYLLTQPADADALGRAWRTGTVSTELPDEPFEPTLQSTNPANTLPVLKRVLPPNTVFESASSAEVEDAVDCFCGPLCEAGVDLDPDREKSTFIALAGMVRRRAELAQNAHTVVLVVSGSTPSPPAPERPDLIIDHQGLAR